MRPTLLLLAPLALLLACPLPDSTDPIDTGEDLEPFDEATAARLQAELDAILAETGAPGVTAAVRVPGHEPWVGAAGVRSLGGDPMPPEQRLRAGSVTKTVTAAAVLQLVEEGLLSLDDPLSTWWDEHPRAADISVRSLLDHSSGLPLVQTMPEVQGGATQLWTPEELLALTVEEPLEFEPGTASAYANTNYLALSLVLEGVTGEPWHQVLNEGVLVDAGLADSALPGPDDGWLGSGPGYLGTYDAYGAVHNTVVGASGNMVSTAEDLATWVWAAWGSDRVLSEASQEVQLAAPWPLGGGAAYGLGVITLEDDWGTQLWHNGALTGYVSWAGYRPEDGVALAFMGNAWLGGPPAPWDPGWSTEATMRMWSAFYEE